VLEKIPASLAKKITSALTIPTIGIGAGKFCDGQILVTPDMLALNVDFHPRFVRHYSKLASEINKAVKSYIGDVKKGSFPSIDESY
jgi:3-methyl-2-oxobutanoate hydroxymethyltransferase